MNILLISKYAAPPSYSKMPARLYILAKKFVSLGNSVTLITSDSNHLSDFPVTNHIYNYEETDGISIVWLKTMKYLKTASVRRVLRWFDFELKLFFFPRKKLNPDVIIVSSLSILTIVYGVFLKNKYKCKLVFEIRDIWPLTMTEEAGYSRLHPFVIFLSWIEKYGYKKADLIVGTMPKLDLHVYNILGYSRPFHCSPLGYDVLNYNDNLSISNVKLNKKFIIGYAGSIGITNDLENFIDSIELLKNNKDIHFKIVGSGDLKLKFQQQLNDCDNVSFLSRIPQSEVQNFLQNCDAVFLSTKKSEVWKYGQSMNKIVEYMLAGKPIIASYSGYQSMVNEANCGEFLQVDSPYDLVNIFIKYSKFSNHKINALGLSGKQWLIKHRTYTTLAKDYVFAIKNVSLK